MTNKDYILQQARDNQMKSFFIKDSRGNVVHQSDTPNSLEGKYKELESFLNNHTGVFEVQLRNTAGKGMFPPAKQFPSLLIGEYSVMLEKKEEPKISGMDFMSGISGFEIMRSYESEKQALNDKYNNLLMEKMRMEQKYEKMLSEKDNIIREKENQLSQAKSSDAKIMGYLSKFSDVISPVSSRPINGTGSESYDTTTAASPQKEKIIQAVNKLMAIDDNFADNITKLAELAEKSPAIYQQAQTMLNSMG